MKGTLLLIAALLCAGCANQERSFSANPPSVPGAYATPGAVLLRPNTRGWFVRPNFPERLVYVAAGDAILVYPERGGRNAPLAEITQGVSSAYGVCFDREGNLYVANQYGNNVTVYPPGATSPSKFYSGSLARPLYPIVDRQGRLWVSNADNGTVTEYSRDGSRVKLVLQTPGVEADGMDFDSNGDLFVAYRTSAHGNGSIEEFPEGSSHGTVLGMTLDQPQSVIVMPTGTILAVETGGPDRIDVFPPGYTAPVLEVGLNKVPTQLAVTATYGSLYVSSFSNDSVYVTPYPLQAHGDPNHLHEKIDASGYGIVQGIALNNGQVF
jgi:sugar lactone lactonase YvrE